MIDLHDPNLRVGRTLDFALRMNTPSDAVRQPREKGGEPLTNKEYQDKNKEELMKVFGLTHTHDTKVGDQYVRGVSGMSTLLATLHLSGIIRLLPTCIPRLLLPLHTLAMFTPSHL